MLAILIAVSTPGFGAGIAIGDAESAVTLPASTHYSGALNVRPGNGDTVSNNPPAFTWFYGTNHWAGGDGVHSEGSASVRWQTNAFQFQVATQADFGGTLAVDVNTPTAFYNFLSPFSTNATRQFWWRVKYVTGGTPYFTNGPYTFTIAGGSTNWDRSMLADANYLTTNAVHPMFCFRAGEQSAIWTWATDSQTTALDLIRTRAANATNQSYFHSHTQWPTQATVNPTFATVNPADAFTRVNDLGSVLFLNIFSGETRWNNASMTGWLETNLNKVARWHNHVSNNWAWVDYGQPAGSPQLIRLLIASYDWLWTNNTSTYRYNLVTNALQGITYASRFWNNNNIHSASATPPGQLIFQADWDYDSLDHCAPWDSWTKLPNSHKTLCTYASMLCGFIAHQENKDNSFAFNWIVNYLFARMSPYAGFAAYRVGPYGYTDTHTYERTLFSGLMVFDVAYPQARIDRSEFAQRFPDWYTRMNPYRMRKYHGAYGDGRPDGYTGAMFGDKRRGWDLAAFSRSGLAMQAYEINREFSNTLSDTSAQWDLLPLRYHFRNTPAQETNTTSKLYPEDGYVVASQISPAEFDCYTNGVGFSIAAEPMGPEYGHSIASSLAPDLWAYGAQLTDGGGASLDAYGYKAAASPGLFINGLGQGDVGHALYGWSPTVAIQSYIANYYSSGTNIVYLRADGTGMFTNEYHPHRGIVNRVTREIAFVRSKYWVFRDRFQTSSNCTFGFRWHIPWAFRYELSGSPLANETEFSGARFGSNSLAMGTNGFTYSAGNYADSAVPNPARVPVHVFWGNDTNTIGTFRAFGTTSLGSSATGVNGTSDTNSTLNPFVDGGTIYATVNPDRAVGMWITNKTLSTDFSFYTVIIPQQSGVNAPTFTRIADNRFTVVYDGVTDTIEFPAAGDLFTLNYEAPASAPMRIRLRTKLQAKKSLNDSWHDKTNQLADVELDSEQAQFFRVKMESERIRP